MHNLVGGGSHNLGYHAFIWATILHGNAIESGKYPILKYLPDKIAQFLYEYHNSDYLSLELPPLELDRRDTNVHGVLKPYQVEKLSQYVENVQYTKYVEYVLYVNLIYIYIYVCCIFFYILHIQHIIHINLFRTGVFIRRPGISEGAFQLRIDNIWFCKLVLLFTIETKSDTGMKQHACVFVSVLEEYKGHRRPGLHILHILHFIHIYHTVHILYILHILRIMI
jgi:hypothetical protein